MEKPLLDSTKTFLLGLLAGLCMLQFNTKAPRQSEADQEAKWGMPQRDPLHATLKTTPLDSVSQYNPWDRNYWQETVNEFQKRQNKYMKDWYSYGYFQGWLAQFDCLRDKPLFEQMEQVNSWVNDYNIKYESDSAQYGRDDYWASPYETAASLKGDCDDYAILKREVLSYLGVPPERLFIAIVGPLGTDSVDHAVLLVDLSPEKPSITSFPHLSPDPGDARFAVLDNDAGGKILLLEETQHRIFWVVRGDNLVLHANATDVPRPAVQKPDVKIKP